MLLPYNNKSVLNIFREFLKPWSSPGVALMPLRVAPPPRPRQPTPEECQYCTVITSMRMVQDAQGDSDDKEIFARLPPRNDVNSVLLSLNSVE